MLSILYKDDHFVAVHKPAGFLVHKTRISDGNQIVLQTLRDLIWQRVYPIHRLDRQASGVLLFGLSPEAASEMGKLWMDQQVQKKYWLMVRGWAPESGEIDRPLKRLEKSGEQDARTLFTRLGTGTLPLEVGPYPTARYSLVEAAPKTGRMHQLRRHLAGIDHPVIGDAKHGDYRHNKAIESAYGVKRLHLFGHSIAFRHPFTSDQIEIRSVPDMELYAFWAKLGWETAMMAPFQ